ncbi:MAG: 16S rRNA (uracil(1498)-N(3))-methyltransferase [Fibrobacter sp.]|nr:16S rRNA (uracil(1498)-N(3))-methyltransferase [Fibrobacter sp.]
MKTPDSRFYCPLIQNGIVTLDENESSHAVKVCRATQGDLLELCDGQGHFAVGTIVTADPKACQVEISKVETPKPSRPLLNLAIACLKDDALEDVVFHAAQTEIASITFLRTDYSQEPKNSDLHKLVRRSELKSLVSLKQSKKPWLTEICGPVEFKEWLKGYRGDLILCDVDGEKTAPEEVIDKLAGNPAGDKTRGETPTPVTLLVGPEGGFSPDEIRMTKEFSGGKSYALNLGNTRLRARTAAIVALGKLL